MQAPSHPNHAPGGSLVVFAVPAEAAPFRRIAPPGTAVLVTGMGARRSEERLTRHLEQSHRPRHVLTSGFCGGLHPELATGQVLFEASDPFLAASLTACGARQATFLTSRSILTHAADKARAHAESGADAVEMESAAIHAVCHRFRIPCATVRVVSDDAATDLPLDFNRFLDADDQTDIPRLIRHLLARPHRIPALMRFNREIRRAAAHLSGVLARFTASAGRSPDA